MRCVVALFCAVIPLVVACERSPVSGSMATEPNPPKAAVLTAAEQGDLVIGGPILCKNLAIFPVSSKTPKDEEEYHGCFDEF